jgi:hypothetical protein
MAIQFAPIIAFLAKKGIQAAIKKFGKKAVQEARKHAKDMTTKPTTGQSQTKAGVRSMRNARQLGRQSAVVGAGIGAAGTAKVMSDKIKAQKQAQAAKLAEMRKKLKAETDAKKRAQLQARIEKEVAKAKQFNSTNITNKRPPKRPAVPGSIRPKARPKT